MMRKKAREICEREGGKQEHDKFAHKTRKIPLEPTTARVGVHSELEHFPLDHDWVWGRNVQMSVA